ncbi:MAG TPA: protein kinase, partial [Cytophagales bacterium]|nr:protein kinase [Cytophagales bacterium]
HEHLVPILGRIMGHPLQKQGLVMELISSSYITLGLAPTFDTCTRDVYPPHLAFTYTEILSILSGIADVVGYLHQRGIMHGDLYAHNIQINNRCVPILGDFGAATRYERTHGMDSIHPLESIEVRAFGCLIEDLLGLADNNADEVVRSSLTILKQACMRTDVGLRPSFEDIRAQLQLLKAMLV